MNLSTIVRTLAGALALILLLATASPARAGAADRLKIEIPPDVETLKPGETIGVQVVGIDADGARVGFGKKQVVLTATHGKVEVVKAPYEYRYTAPAGGAAALTVRLSARLEGAPRVRGTLDVTVQAAAAPAGKRGFVRLVLKSAAETVPFGQTVAIQVHGERADGTLEPIKDRQVTVTTKGPGTTKAVFGTVSYTAPARAESNPKGTRVTLTAALTRRPEIKGSLEFVLGRYPGGKPPPPPPENDPGKDDVPSSANDSPGVTWPSGNVRVATWRTRDTATLDWSKKTRKLPDSGAEFVAQAPWQKLRVVVLRSDIVKVEFEWWVGRKKGAGVHVEKAGSDGRFRLQRNKSGNYVCHLEGSPPDTGKPLRLNLLLTRSDGSILREEMVMRRGKGR